RRSTVVVTLRYWTMAGPLSRMRLNALKIKPRPTETLMTTFSKLLCGLALIAAGPASLAADFPERAVTWVVPWAAGGASDTVGRIVGEQLSGVLKQPVIVDNRPGAGGNIGTEMVARAT